MIGLPTSLEVNGTEYEIRTDFRDILTILTAFNDHFSDDHDTDVMCKANVCLQILYKDSDSIPQADIKEAYKQACWFIDCGNKYTEEREEQLSLMNWDQDEQIVFPAINRVAGKETRLSEYIHWWSFIGMYMEIGECLFSQVIQIRKKLSDHKKLEKYEEEFYKKNKSMVELECWKTPEDRKAEAELNDVLKDII